MQLDHMFAAMGDPARFAIIERLLTEGELPAGDIQSSFEISAPAISRHLKVLHEAGIVARRVDGQRRLYSVRASAMRDINSWTINHRAFWEASLDRLDAALEREMKLK